MDKVTPLFGWQEAAEIERSLSAIAAAIERARVHMAERGLGCRVRRDSTGWSLALVPKNTAKVLRRLSTECGLNLTVESLPHGEKRFYFRMNEVDPRKTELLGIHMAFYAEIAAQAAVLAAAISGRYRVMRLPHECRARPVGANPLAWRFSPITEEMVAELIPSADMSLLKPREGSNAKGRRWIDMEGTKPRLLPEAFETMALAVERKTQKLLADPEFRRRAREGHLQRRWFDRIGSGGPQKSQDR